MSRLRILIPAFLVLAFLCAAAPAGASTATARTACHAQRHRHTHRARCATRARTPRRHPTRRHSTPRPIASVTPSPSIGAAASIASVLATPCQNAALTPTPADLELIRAATFCLVNQERARNGELPLTPNAQLEQAAQAHSDDMVEEDYFSHVAPNGETPVDRVRATGYIPNAQDGYTIGENVAWGTLSLATPASIVAAWIASPEHLANILAAQYRDSAIGVVAAAPAALASGQPGAVYTQEFGVITTD